MDGWKRETDRKYIPEQDSIKYWLTPEYKVLTYILFLVSAPPTTTQPVHSSSPTAMTSGMPSTEPLPPTVASVTPESYPSTLDWVRARRLNSNECFRYVYGTFVDNITIIGRARNEIPFLCVICMTFIQNCKFEKKMFLLYYQFVLSNANCKAAILTPQKGQTSSQWF